MKRISKIYKKNENGFALLEVVVSIALLAIIGAGFLGALSTSSRTLLITDIRQTAKNFAEMQMEFIKSQDFDEYINHDDSPDGSLEYVGYAILVGDELPSEYAGFSVKDIDEDGSGPDAAGDGKVFGIGTSDINLTQSQKIGISPIPTPEFSYAHQLQKIVITIQHQGKDIITIEGYKEKPK